MATTTITALTGGSALGGTEVAPFDQSGATVKITATQIKTWTSDSPTLVTPTLGVATATSINKVAITAPATSATLTIANGKTLTVNNTITLAGTDSTTMTFPTTSATIARTDAANTFTGTQTIGALVATTVNGNTFTTGTGTLTIAASKTLTANASLTLTGTDSTTMTFPTTTATIARTDSAQTFTGTQTFSSAPVNSSATAGRIAYAGSSKEWADSAGLFFVASPARITISSASSDTHGIFETTNNGVSDYSQIAVQCNSSLSAIMAATVSGWSTSGAYVADQGIFQGAKAGGTMVLASHASGIVKVVTGGTAASNEAIRWDASGHTNIADAKNVVIGTTTGTKIGTATSQKLGFWNATPVVQQVLATGAGASVDNVITFLQTIGLCKQS